VYGKQCKKGCPLENDITDFIKEVKNKNYKMAFDIMSKTSVLMPICGRICPHSKQCEGSCVRGRLDSSVNIGSLEAMIGDMALENKWKITSPKECKYNVAVVGAGPAGLTCSAFLRRNGIGVTLYEKYDYLGGLLIHGIPEFRLSKEIVKNVIDNIIDLGIDVKYNKELGKNLNLQELKNTHDAIFLSIGANISNNMNVQGEELTGVYGGNELLEKDLNIDYNNKIVAIIGGGDVAIDVARTAIRNGAKKSIIVYRRSDKEMPANIEEIEAAKKDGVEFLFQTNIVEILGNKQVEKIEVIKTKMVKKENDTRLSPVNIDGSNYFIECDYVVKAIGSHPDNVVASLGLGQDNGKILIDEKRKDK